ncbi:MAG: PLP-dependent transferase [Candidatus Latescibacterota bacterium]|nr:MAG: PLP-dependent transferase [Candidatus Latescibacterota bacterium]
MPESHRLFKNLETNVVHAGESPRRVDGAVVHPVFQTANYLMEDADSYANVRYMRLNNSPNHHLLARRIAAIESAEKALVTSSGMAAITSTILSFVGSGDHMLTHRALYGGTQNFLDDDAPALQIDHTPIDMGDPSGWEAALRPQTRLIYVESISNPLMEVGDLKAVVKFARAHDLVSVIDNTFATPVNFRPHEIGFDVVVHSATKYLNGHSDIVAGVATGSKEKVERIRHKLNHLGGALDAHACFLLERGLKTLAVRVQRQNANALQLARFLSGCPEIRRVNYPGLASDPGHERARALFSGFGGMLSFYMDSDERAAAFLERVRIPLHAASLGGAETLVVRPSRSSHLGLPPAEREKIGVTDDLVRVSVGIESAEELVDDFAQALGS